MGERKIVRKIVIFFTTKNSKIIVYLQGEKLTQSKQFNKTQAKQLIQTRAIKLNKLIANKSKFQEIRLHIPLISKLASTIYQYHYRPLLLVQVSDLTQRIEPTPQFNQPSSPLSKKPYRDTVTKTASPLVVWIMVFMFPDPGGILITALRYNYRNPSWPQSQSITEKTTATYSTFSERRWILSTGDICGMGQSKIKLETLETTHFSKLLSAKIISMMKSFGAKNL